LYSLLVFAHLFWMVCDTGIQQILIAKMTGESFFHTKVFF